MPEPQPLPCHGATTGAVAASPGTATAGPVHSGTIGTVYAGTAGTVYPGTVGTAPVPWDARLARRLITPLKDSWVTPNYLTTVRLCVGLAAAGAFLPGTYGWSNLAALLLILSNFLDHTDGELARISGKSSRLGHLYDLVSDAVVTVLLFVAMGAGMGARRALVLGVPPVLLGAVAGVAIALIFWLRLRIEDLGGKAASRQASMGGFETEDVLYLLPLVTLCNGVAAFTVAASIGAPLFAIWVIYDYRRLVRRLRPARAEQSTVGAA
ncbi:MAG TPA: CDP-alcohol phosphatidyltransferase family protein [Steroidobacteraceae bacterium]|nr:CDP-alcohol phosphatidyltransferase family protein [Steroidobacteraceae bacterium]